MVEQEGDYVYILIDQTAMDNSKRLQGFKDMGYILEADTLEELAEKMNVPADNLVKTVEAYQEAVRTGVDEFGRTNNLSIDFSNPPYYAVTTSPGLQVSLGGILVDDSLRCRSRTAPASTTCTRWANARTTACSAAPPPTSTSPSARWWRTKSWQNNRLLTRRGRAIIPIARPRFFTPAKRPTGCGSGVPGFRKPRVFRCSGGCWGR